MRSEIKNRHEKSRAEHHLSGCFYVPRVGFGVGFSILEGFREKKKSIENLVFSMLFRWWR
jgi:hypothetical protein